MCRLFFRVFAVLSLRNLPVTFSAQLDPGIVWMWTLEALCISNYGLPQTINNKSIVLYTGIESLETEIKTMSVTSTHGKNYILRCKSNHVQDLYAENYKMLMAIKDLNGETHSWSGNPNTISSPQIDVQHRFNNTHQNYKIFLFVCRYRQNYPKVDMERQN